MINDERLRGYYEQIGRFYTWGVKVYYFARLSVITFAWGVEKCFWVLVYLI